MGLFDDTDNNRKDEVVIDAPEDNSSNETRLGKQVESSLIDDSEPGSDTRTSSESNVSLDDIHRQNETIIDLLEQLVDNKGSSSSGATGRAGSSNNSRVTDRNSGSKRVTDRKDSSDNESIGDGMNELL